MAASVEPGPVATWCGRAAGSPEIWAAVGPMPTGSMPNTFAGVNQLALQDVVAWHRDTHGEPAAAEQDVPAAQGMLTVGSAIPAAMRASATTRRAAAAYAASGSRYPRRT
jgi:hypothetical protein